MADIFDALKNLVTGNDRDPNRAEGEQGGLMDVVSNFLGGNNNDRNPNDVRPASEDPYGDPADEFGSREVMHGQDVLPASEDPYGDPADEMNEEYAGHGVRPASEDPYGDPADHR